MDYAAYVQEYVPWNWDFMLHWALALDEDDAYPLKKRADNVEWRKSCVHQSLTWANTVNFLCRELSQVYSTRTPWRRRHYRLTTLWCPLAMCPLGVQPWVSWWSVHSAYYVDLTWTVSSSNDVTKSRPLEDCDINLRLCSNVHPAVWLASVR